MGLLRRGGKFARGVNVVLHGHTQPAIIHHHRGTYFMVAGAATVLAVGANVANSLTDYNLGYLVAHLANPLDHSNYTSVVCPLIGVGLVLAIFVSIQLITFRASGAYATMQRLFTSKSLHGEAAHDYEPMPVSELISLVVSNMSVVMVAMTMLTSFIGILVVVWSHGVVDWVQLLMSLILALFGSIFLVIFAHLSIIFVPQLWWAAKMAGYQQENIRWSLNHQREENRRKYAIVDSVPAGKQIAAPAQNAAPSVSSQKTQAMPQQPVNASHKQSLKRAAQIQAQYAGMIPDDMDEI